MAKTIETLYNTASGRRGNRPKRSGTAASRISHRGLCSLAEATAEFMRCEGLEVRIASTGRDALEIAAAFQPDFVLCDVMLPDMPGSDLASALRASAGARNALIALHSAMHESDLRACYSDAPVDMFLPKPITKEKLDALLSQLEFLQRSAPAMPSRAEQKAGMLKPVKSKRAHR